jgi:hypothetical protein
VLIVFLYTVNTSRSQKRVLGEYVDLQLARTPSTFTRLPELYARSTFAYHTLYGVLVLNLQLFCFTVNWTGTYRWFHGTRCQNFVIGMRHNDFECYYHLLGQFWKYEFEGPGYCKTTGTSLLPVDRAKQNQQIFFFVFFTSSKHVINCCWIN